MEVSLCYKRCHRAATSIAKSKKINAVPATFTATFDASDFGNSHQPSVLMNNGIVRYVVSATLMTLPMNIPNEEFTPASRGLRNRVSSITMGKRPSNTSMAAFQFGGP